MRAPPAPSLPVSAWLESDQHLWHDAHQRLSKLTPKTVRVVKADYGRFLAFLASVRELEPALLPADRLTPDRVRRYVAKFREQGFRTMSIVKRLWGLRCAISAMQPGSVVSFACLPGARRGKDGRRRRSSAPKPPKDPFEGWPEIDRRLWKQGMVPGDILDDPAQGSFRPDTVDSIIRDYGSWLRFLQSKDLPAPDAKPADRVVRSAVQEYVRWRVLRGNKPSTIVTRLSRLRSALGIMEPQVDFRWLTYPKGRPIRSLLPKPKPGTHPVIDSRVVYQWGLQLMSEAEPSLDMSEQRVAFRDGLLIALLAARAPRQRSIISLRIGKHVTRIENSFWLTLEADDLKGGPPLEYSVPKGLTLAMERYLQIRTQMLGAEAHDLFWVCQSGRPLARRTIAAIIRARSKKRFGFSFGPHRFRHGIGTSAPIYDPARPAIASAILNNSSRMVERHYNIGGMLERRMPSLQTSKPNEPGPSPSRSGSCASAHPSGAVVDARLS